MATGGTRVLIFAFAALLLLSHTLALVCKDGGGEKEIEKGRINDNYCDCGEDGKDETATGACAHVIQHFFTCEKDVDKKSIPFSFVRDKVCDCCDGSDEAPGVCQDTCEQEREKKWIEISKEIEKHTKGEDLKRQYLKRGSQAVKEMDATIKQMKEEVERDRENLQAKIYSPDQQLVQELYNAYLYKEQRLRSLEVLAASPQVFGKKKELYSLFGKCFSLVSNEKHFKGGTFETVAKNFMFGFCPFSMATQVEVGENGATTGKPTLLGLWQEWEERGNNSVMIYSGGDECWNGPLRVVSVDVVCALEDGLIDVRENGKCTYEFVFGTPAACDKKHADKLKKYLRSISPESEQVTHDEL